MSVIGSNVLAGASGQSAGDFEISRSLRFNRADTAYLNRTPSSASNRRTWTWSCWIKRNNLSSAQNIFVGSDNPTKNNTTHSAFYFHPNNKIYFGGWNSPYIITDAVYRDASAWYHIVLSVDTTQSTSTDRIKVYVNNVLQSYSTGAGFPGQNTDLGINQAHPHYIGGNDPQSGYASHMYAEINFIDGSALDPTSFGQADDNGVWQAIDTAGLTFGTNGFRLEFADNSGATATTLGKDTSGNSNNFTPNNLSVTAGSGNDSLVDTPTNAATPSDSGAGGEVVGNYATLNSLVLKGSSSSFANGNLEAIGGSTNGFTGSTINPVSGKYYFELYIEYDSGQTDGNMGVGIVDEYNFSVGNPSGNSYPSTMCGFFGRTDINSVVNGSESGASTSEPTSSYQLGVAVDYDAKNITAYLNGSQGNTVSFSSNNNPLLYFNWGNTNNKMIANFGQRAFAYTNAGTNRPSADYKSLNTANLTPSTIANSSKYFDAKLISGNSSTQTVSGFNFSPSFVWAKSRSHSTDHYLFDIVRGATNELKSNSTSAEGSNSGLTQFNSDGYNMGSDSSMNTSGRTYVNWVWDGGTSTVTNNDGSIASQVRASAASGFSIVGWSGTGSNATVGHGLNDKPGLVLVKNRSATASWAVWSTPLSGSQFLALNTLNAPQSSSAYWNSTEPTSSVINVGTDSSANGSSNNMIAYCFASVLAFSSIGTYSGNGSDDGPFVYTGFKPRLIITRAYSSNSNNNSHWLMYDTLSDSNPYNEADTVLYANISNPLNTHSSMGIDILSNGFKLKADTSGYSNYNGWDYLYYAVAENPFQANGGLAR